MCYCPPKENRRQGSVGKHPYTIIIEYREQNKTKPEKASIKKLSNHLPDVEEFLCFKHGWIRIRIRCDGRTIEEYEEGVKYAPSYS